MSEKEVKIQGICPVCVLTCLPNAGEVSLLARSTISKGTRNIVEIHQLPEIWDATK